jgi:hypothetical protein
MPVSAWLDTLFVAGCDPYKVAAVVLLGKPSEAVTQDDRDFVKRVFMHVAARRDEIVRGENEKPLRQAADMFHEIGSALSVEEILGDAHNANMTEKLRESLRENLRSPDQLRKVATDGFELCVRALADVGAVDVTIHECGESALGVRPWSGGDD